MKQEQKYLRFPDPITRHNLTPEEKSVFPEEQRINPECPCRTRGCDYHGFCALCVEKHRKLIEAGRSDPDHGSICQRVKAGHIVLDPKRRP